MTTPDEIIATARSKLGAPYAWGAKGPDTFDCSGFTQWVYAQHGIAVGGDTAEQQTHFGQVVDPGHRQPGDLVFFGDLAGEHAHVGIYIGGDRMIDAPHTGAGVREESVTDWAASGERLRGYRRYLPAPLDTGLDPLWEVFVSIAKDDTDARRFTVRLIYALFGHREPDVPGLDHWVQGTKDAGLDATLAAILDSPEFTADQEKERAGG